MPKTLCQVDIYGTSLQSFAVINRMFAQMGIWTVQSYYSLPAVWLYMWEVGCIWWINAEYWLKSTDQIANEEQNMFLGLGEAQQQRHDCGMSANVLRWTVCGLVVSLWSLSQGWGGLCLIRVRWIIVQGETAQQVKPQWPDFKRQTLPDTYTCCSVLHLHPNSFIHLPSVFKYM